MSVKNSLPSFLYNENISWSTLATKRSCRPSPFTSAASTPMPDRGVPLTLKTNFGGEPNFFELPLAAIRKEEVLHGVVGHEQIHLPVAIDVRRDDAETLAEGATDVGTGTHFREGAVSVVVIEQARCRLEHPRDAVEALPQ